MTTRGDPSPLPPGIVLPPPNAEATGSQRPKQRRPAHRARRRWNPTAPPAAICPDETDLADEPLAQAATPAAGETPVGGPAPEEPPVGGPAPEEPEVGGPALEEPTATTPAPEEPAASTPAPETAGDEPPAATPPAATPAVVAAAVDHRPDHEAVRRPLRAISSHLARRRRRPEENDDAGGGDGDSSATDAAAEADESSARHRWRTVARTAAWTSAILAVAVVLLVFVFPTRTYLSQRHQLGLTAAELRLLDQQNAQLSAQVARLQTDAEIERLAREQYHFVRPGERAFAILPAPPPPTTTPPARPPAAPSRGILHRLTSWIP